MSLQFGKLRVEHVIFAGGSELVECFCLGLFLRNRLLETLESRKGVIRLGDAGHCFRYLPLRHGRILTRYESCRCTICFVDAPLQIRHALLERLARAARRIYAWL